MNRAAIFRSSKKGEKVVDRPAGGASHRRIRRAAHRAAMDQIPGYEADQEKKRLSSPSAVIGDPAFLSSKIWIPAKILPE